MRGQPNYETVASLNHLETVAPLNYAGASLNDAVASSRYSEAYPPLENLQVVASNLMEVALAENLTAAEIVALVVEWEAFPHSGVTAPALTMTR